MVGITSFGGYIPRFRLNRGVIYGANAWIAPGTIGAARGEKAIANWDEDSITMAVEAARDCISGFDKSKIDAAYMASVNFPFEDRQNAGIFSTALNLEENIESADFTASMRAGVSAMLAGFNAVKGGDYQNVLVSAGERRLTKMAYMHELWAGDGAASVLIGDKDVVAEFKGSSSVTVDFSDHYRGDNEKYDYNWEERWIRDEGIATIVPKALKGLFEKTSLAGKDVAKFVMPCVFARVAAKMAGQFDVPAEVVADNMHAVCGDTGSAHPLVMLVSALEEAKPGDKIVVVAFGNGCTAMLFEVTDNISKMAAKRGIKGSLAIRKEEQNYLKYLTHRGMLDQDLTMRTETNWRTAISTLYRHRKQILGMVGGKCTKCGTIQYPLADYCVKPECNAHKSQEDYEFANEPGEIMSYTADLLTFTMDPPAHYGMITFDNGGRGMFDFTDYDMGKIDTGMPVEMVFRVRNIDKTRNFTQYSWKAKPIIKQEEA